MTAPNTRIFDYAIIGAGFGGIIAALKLQELGKTSFVIFERAADIGGTWRDNVYPGCACDVASNLYSISSQPNPTWSHTYSRQPEIWQYMKDVVKRSNLTLHLRCNTQIIRAEFREAEGRWYIFDHLETLTIARMLLCAPGPLSRPNKPTFQGMERFQGKIVHSAEWRTDIDLAGKRVAVIGTGASAIQIVPAIAADVQHLSVVQRTPAWILPRHDKPTSPFRQRLFTRFPAMQCSLRTIRFWSNEAGGISFVKEMPQMRRFVQWYALRHLKRQVENVELRKKLTPAYTLGCKRVLVSDDFYPTFNQLNVCLETSPIQEFTEQGLRFRGGREEVFDVIILATGFHGSEGQWDIEICGLGGKHLMEEWQKTGAEAYLGTTVADFPNMALLLGPNTGGGHNSVLDTMESQMHYIAEYIRTLDALPQEAFLNLRHDVQTAYNQHLQAMFKGTVWSADCKSWYMNTAGKNTTIYPHLNTHFRKVTRRLNTSEYEVLVTTSEQQSVRINPALQNS